MPYLCPHPGCGARLANRGNLPGHLRRAHGAPKKIRALKKISANAPKKSATQKYSVEILDDSAAAEVRGKFSEPQRQEISKTTIRNLQPIVRRVKNPPIAVLRSPHFRFRYGSPEAETLIGCGWGRVSDDGQWVSADMELIRVNEFTKTMTRERYAGILGVSGKTERR